MALSAFDDKTEPPNDEALANMLGKSYALWTLLLRLLSAGDAPLTAHWGFTSRKTGWGLRLKRGERIIVYVTPCQGHFLASFALGEKAVAAAHASGLPNRVLAIIDASKKYAEGRGVRLVVKTAADVRNVERLAAIKMAH